MRLSNLIALGVATLTMCSILNEMPVKAKEETAVKTVEVSTKYTQDEFLQNLRAYIEKPYQRFAEDSNTESIGEYAWCASFVSHCLGFDVTGDTNPNRSCSSIADAYKAAGRFHDETEYVPQIGDLVIYDENNDPSNYEHIGVVSHVYENGSFKVIEGNAFKWVPMYSENNIDPLKMDTHTMYDIPISVEEFDSFVIGTDTYRLEYQEDGSYYLDYANACWDYYYHGKLAENNYQMRKVIEFNPSEIKHLFIAGFCSPEFTQKVEYDFNNDGEFNVADLVSFINQILANGFPLQKNRDYDINHDGIVSIADFVKLKHLFLD